MAIFSPNIRRHSLFHSLILAIFSPLFQRGARGDLILKYKGMGISSMYSLLIFSILYCLYLCYNILSHPERRWDKWTFREVWVNPQTMQAVDLLACWRFLFSHSCSRPQECSEYAQGGVGKVGQRRLTYLVLPKAYFLCFTVRSDCTDESGRTKTQETVNKYPGRRRGRRRKKAGGGNRGQSR